MVAIAIDEPEADTTVNVVCSPLSEDDPDGDAVLHFVVLVRGKDPTPEQEEMVTQLLRMCGSEAKLIKAQA